MYFDTDILHILYCTRYTRTFMLNFWDMFSIAVFFHCPTRYRIRSQDSDRCGRSGSNKICRLRIVIKSSDPDPDPTLSFCRNLPWESLRKSCWCRKVFGESSLDVCLSFHALMVSWNFSVSVGIRIRVVKIKILAPEPDPNYLNWG